MPTKTLIVPSAFKVHPNGKFVALIVTSLGFIGETLFKVSLSNTEIDGDAFGLFSYWITSITVEIFLVIINRPEPEVQLSGYADSHIW